MSETASSIAKRFVGNIALEFLAQRGMPVRMGEILERVSEDVPVTPKALKLALRSDVRLAEEERRWSLRFPAIDGKRPLERSIVDVLRWAEVPMPCSAIGQLLARAYVKTPEVLSRTIARIVEKRDEFFVMGGGLVGLSEWLLQITSDDEDDLIFDNFEDTSELERVAAEAAAVDWDAAGCLEASLQLLDRVPGPVSSKALGMVCWRHLQGDYDPARHFEELWRSRRAVLVGQGDWCGERTRTEIIGALAELDRTGPEVELYPEDMPKPITVEDDDLASIRELVLSGVGPCRVEELVESQFNIAPKDPGFDQVRAAVEKYLRADPGMMWVGWDRWQALTEVPPDVRRLPDEMQPVYLDIEGVGGQKLDQELEDEGLEADLAEQIHNPLLALGGHCSVLDGGSIRCVVTYWPRYLGLVPIPSAAGALPRQPEYLLLDLVDEAGTVRRCWYNNELQMLFGVKDWYAQVDLPPSGGVFYLQSEAPGRFRLRYEGEHEESVYIEQGRLKDLLAFREDVERTETSTWEIVQQVMRGHSKGVPFPQLFCEVVVVRPSSPRLIASILSSYHGFYERGGLWHFNERDASKGFKKQKRKYIVKR
ncbi:MAG: hypothetical protein ACUVTZ_01205 [Armatimonadota bacterium]